MKPIFTFILFIGFIFNAFSQNNYDNKKDVGFTCGWAGQPTATVIKVTALLKDKKYKEISSLLREGHAGEKFLATVSLENFHCLDCMRFRVWIEK